MQFRILRVENLPLGTRILHPGDEGADVKELQELLALNGFYSGESDGRYGPLTEEAVRLLEQTFRLTTDGIVGHQVIAVLKNPSRQTGRIIYTVKADENLTAISRKYSVNSMAWKSIPGRGNPQKRLYPGMQLLLHEKALFFWDESNVKTASNSKGGLSEPERQLQSNIQVTNLIQPGWLIDPNGDLTCRDGESVGQSDTFRTIEAPPEIWKALFTSKTLQAKLGNRLRKLSSFHFGLDLRTAPLNTIVYWPKFMKSLCNVLKRRTIRFCILPLLPPFTNSREKHPHVHETPIYWLTMPLTAEFAELLIFEPLFNTENALSYESSATQLPQTLIQLDHRQLNHKSLLLITFDCWDWNLDLHTVQTFPYSKARMIRAANSRAAKYSTASKLTMVHYTSRHQPHCMVYQDIQGFEELFAMVHKAHLLGLAIRNFEALGQAGIEVIRNSCTIMPEVKIYVP